MSSWPISVTAEGIEVAELTTTGFVIHEPADVLELIGAGLQRVILHERQLADGFFDLSTGFAGELVQKCQNYGLRVAVVGPGNEGRSTSFRQFAHESNRGQRFVFVASVEEGLRRLASADR